MSKETTWVVVADAARARILRLGDDRKGLVEEVDQIALDARLSSREIASDRPGRTFDRGGPGRHAKEPPTDPARHAKAAFAHELAAWLDDERKKHSFARLVVVAPPQFLGDLRARLPAPLKDLVAAEVAKDVSKLPARDIWPHLQAALKR